MFLEFKISEDDIQTAESELDINGKYEKWHKVEAINKNGIVCAEAEMLVYLRDNKIQKIGF